SPHAGAPVLRRQALLPAPAHHEAGLRDRHPRARWQLAHAGRPIPVQPLRAAAVILQTSHVTGRGVVRTRPVIAAPMPSRCNQIALSAAPTGGTRGDAAGSGRPQAPMRKTTHVYPRPFWRESGLSGQVNKRISPFETGHPFFSSSG